MFSLINIFRIVAFLEGISYVLLLGIAVPIKYGMDNPEYVKLLGMPHGILFVAYIFIAILLYVKLQWNVKTLIAILLASIVPFGTFYIEKKYLKNQV